MTTAVGKTAAVVPEVTAAAVAAEGPCHSMPASAATVRAHREAPFGNSACTRSKGAYSQTSTQRRFSTTRFRPQRPRSSSEHPMLMILIVECFLCANMNKGSKVHPTRIGSLCRRLVVAEGRRHFAGTGYDSLCICFPSEGLGSRRLECARGGRNRLKSRTNSRRTSRYLLGDM
jgi:hypothetical protein